MNKLIKIAIDSISLDGFRGSFLNKLWSDIEAERNGKKLDIYMKNWIFSQLKSMNDISFYITPENSELTFFREGNIKGNMDKGRRLATSNDLNKPIEELEALNERFRIVASQNLRDIAYELVDRSDMTDLTYSTLEFIAMSKKEGILQLDLSKLIPSETPKTIFFHIKKLEILGLIKRKALLLTTDNSGIRTNRIYLSRFAPVDVEATDFEDNEQEQNVTTKTCPMYIELPFDRQIYNIIESNGSAGVYQKDIRFKQLAYKDTVKLLEKVVSKRNLVISYPENVGRTVTYKLVSKFLPDGTDAHGNEDINELMNINKSLLDENKSQSVKEESNNVEERKDTPTKVKKPSKKTIQFVKRKRLLLDELKKNNIIPLVKIRKIFEMNQNNEQEKYLNSLNDDLKTVLDVDALKKQYTIDKKTIKTVIDELVKEKLAQVTNVLIPMSTGITKSLKLLVSPTATEEQINDYISSLRESDLNKIVVTSGTGYSKNLDLSGEESIVKQELTEHKPIETNYFVSLKYGFIRAKMQRVKLLHQFIWMKLHGIEYNISSPFQNESYVRMSSSAKKFMQEFRGNSLSAPIEPIVVEPQEFNPDFTLINIIMDMPVELYCQIIGQPTEIENFMQYKHKTLNELSPSIQAIICERRLFMKRAQVLIDIMLKLSLIKKKIIIDYNNGERLKNEIKFSGHDYTLCNSASIKDINDESLPIKEFMFTSMDDLNNYWNYLETVCLNSAESVNIDQDDDNSREELFPKECFVKTNWLGSSNLRKYQKKILYDSMPIIKLEREQYPNGITPSMEILARKTHLSPHQVSIWYMKQFNRNEKKRKRASEIKSKKRSLKKMKKQEHTEALSNTIDLIVPHILPDELMAPRLPVETIEPRIEEKVEDEDEEIDVQTQFTRALPNRKVTQVNTSKDWESSSSEKFDLPSSIEEFHSMYNFTEDNLPINDTKLCSASCSANYTKDIDKPNYDFALLDYIVTILMVPEKDYQMEKAYKLFGHFFEHEFAECFEALRKNGIITKDRVGSRGYQLTIKYKNLLKHFSKQFLTKLKNANQKYSKELNEPHQQIFFKQEDQYGGIIGYLLSRFINNEIDFDIETCKIDNVDEQQEESNKKSKKDETERPTQPIPEIKIKIESLVDHLSEVNEDPSESKPKTFSVVHWKDIESKLKEENDEEVVKLYHEIYDFIKSKEDKGAKMSELYYKYIQNNNIEYEEAINNLNKIIFFLEKSNLITKISLYYDDAWVSTEYTDRWSVSKDGTNEKVIFYPWISLNGNVDKNSLNRIKLALSYIIYSKPGITFNQLMNDHNIFRPSVMKKVLDMLEKDGIIRYEYNSYRKPCFNSIFEDGIDDIIRSYTKEDYMKQYYMDNNDSSMIYDFSIFPNPDILLKLPIQE